jgi:Uma2 family endonuclease
VPDVAFMSFARLRSLSKKDRQSPNIPPEVVVEVLSPDDKPKDVEAKRKEYLAWGVSLVLIADPDARYVDVFDDTGTYARVDASVEAYSPAAIPDLTLPLRAMFEELDLPEELES